MKRQFTQQSRAVYRNLIPGKRAGEKSFVDDFVVTVEAEDCSEIIVKCVDFNQPAAWGPLGQAWTPNPAIFISIASDAYKATIYHADLFGALAETPLPIQTPSIFRELLLTLGYEEDPEFLHEEHRAQ